MSKKEAHDLVQRARKVGWVYLGIDGRGHHRILWPATGRKYAIPCTPGGGRRSIENAEADIARLSGQLLRPVPGAGRTSTQRAADRKRKAKRQTVVKPVAAPPRPDWRDQLAALQTEPEHQLVTPYPTVYLVVCEDRHFDTTIEGFADQDEAISYAKYLARSLDRHGVLDETLTEPMQQGGWLYYGCYSVESDHVHVQPISIKQPNGAAR
ncbi:hypothetical protein [Nocardia sp. NPDC051833]|uniref:hypothetical protein n=1 Tax=Nocardia sp. NPDC051833 TaxID=3155674 RepID=UPI003428CE59